MRGGHTGSALVLAIVALGCAPDGVDRQEERSNGERAAPMFVRTASGLRTALSDGFAQVTDDARIVLGDAEDSSSWSLRTRGAGAAAFVASGTMIARTDDERTEELEVRPDGSLEQRWRFEHAPNGDAITVRVTVGGVARAELDDDGLVLHSSRRVGARLRYSHAIWIDADGLEHAVPARWDGEDIVLEVPSAVVARSRFPAVLDPRIEPIFGIEAPVEVPWSGWDLRTIRAAGGEHGFVMASHHDIEGLSFSYPRHAFVPSAGAFVDRWGRVPEPERPSYSSYSATVDIIDAGTGFVMAWFTTPLVDVEGYGVRALRLDSMGRPAAGPFWIANGEPLGGALALSSTPTSTLVRWVRPAPAGAPAELCTVRVPRTGPVGPLRCAPVLEAASYSVAVSEHGWLVSWIDAATTEVRAARMLEATATVDALVLSPAVGPSRTTLTWAAAADSYRVVWRDGFVDVPATGAPAVGAPRLPGSPSSCPPAGCGEPRLVRSAHPPLFVWGNELGRFEIDGSWATTGTMPVALTDPSDQVVRSRDGFAVVRGRAQRFDASMTPIDPTPELHLREMNVQIDPAVAAGHERYAVAWADLRNPFHLLDSARVARLDAAGTLLDVTVFEGDARCAPTHAIPVSDRFVVLGRGVEGTGTRREPLQAVSVAALGSADPSGPHAIAELDPNQLSVVPEGATALVGWNDLGEAHLARLDAHGRVVSTHAQSERLLGLCRDYDDTIAVVGSSSEWWIATVDRAGSPVIRRRWRLARFPSWGGPLVTSLRNECAVLWTDRSGTGIGAVFDSDGFITGPRPLVTSAGDPITATAAVSFDGWSELVLRADRTHLWVLSSRLDARAFVPFEPEATWFDSVAFALAGASARPGEHLLVWDSSSPARSVGRLPVRLHVRMLGPDRPVGEPCVGDFECASRACVDGLCCNRACVGACEACSVAEGASADGACTPLGSSTVCRTARDACDRPEACDGVSPGCPTDGLAPDGTTCEDDLACNGSEQCASGECRGSSPLACTPPSGCMTGACVEPGGCVWTAIEGCCERASDCDDEDPATVDECSDGMCRWTPVHDAGVMRDGGAIDAGAVDAAASLDGGAIDAGARIDAGSAVRPDAVDHVAGGCACRASGLATERTSVVAGLLCLAVGVARRRRGLTRRASRDHRR